ncbi:pilus assembly FimT family protein [Puniceicoccus vermicola]|uniref:Prepilin-type N-terminal cleavage/methylation domain-containing protein n=1 Tax=Puniceicoccus vermicola TaxID=388746 RepID=A0A7X1AXJ1_9BACT|nr:prepilin-type N-terminal cleavage/methylation domain-containing protein [Puniceicoccus vermicola]MBC2601855.1 prepilin-type N-terminal cleavage/methylation domain-containing protein [Puniceicoccus vermicola]
MITRNRKAIHCQGFTIMEMMLVVFVLGLIMMMSMGFFVESFKATFVSEQKNMINGDIRTLTSQLAEAAKEANFTVLYKSYSSEDRDKSEDRMLDGNSGDFIVFGFQEEPDLSTSINAPIPIMRITGYYRAPMDPNDPTSEGPVRSFDTDQDFNYHASGAPLLSPIDPLNPPTLEKILEELYPEATIGNNREVVEMSEGLADKRLFYNFGKSTIMVNGKIIHGVDAKRVTDTYNFTISTRR